MILTDGLNVRPRGRAQAPSTPSPTVPEPETLSDDPAALLASLTVPEIRRLLDDGLLDPWETIEHERVGKARLGVVNYASEIVGLR